ncbi:hypothetical protein L228DRAFT_492 [Xylona heveae TC161]|uniref:G-protein coupled receptors family 2 profile 2 domain-containing protein n=1 Tax=Xylona heveae (strain CBS 132557 / TC161) TaxID=1328760 RepID=A0A165J840_XYLHT|nr:hypothetical protein L228DRAFT_492 [Xylona heveae TC161]KZF25875.1 hypothetical protein L228DRAFT_492 [Xylona heveae TC161]
MSAPLLNIPGCPAPFKLESDYPATGGFIQGRACQSLPTNITCCLPCPMTDWVYPDNFSRLSLISNWLNVGGLILCLFLLLSFAALPVEKTRRHYLSICLIGAIILLQLGFVIPLGANPGECYDAITPHDMRSDTSCALSGSFLLAGGFATMLWVFIRVLSMHLQVCWDIVPGHVFFFGSLFAGWFIPAILLSIALSLTGVSYRFGKTCHINHDKSNGDFWGPLLAIAAAASILQFITFGYCIHVYLKSLMAEGTGSGNSSGLPSHNGSVTAATARAAYRKVRRVIALQWRGIALILIIIVDLVFFSVIFLSMDAQTQNNMKHPEKMEAWLECLVENGGDKNKCLDLASHLVVNEATVMAVLVLLSWNGYWITLLVGRWTMVTGWFDVLRKRLRKKREFVSVDARRLPQDARTYEMLSSTPRPHLKTPDTSVISPIDSIHHTDQGNSPDYFGRDANYSSPVSSFSSPKAPQSVMQRDWDPRSTFAPK